MAKEMMSPKAIQLYWDKFFKANKVQEKQYSQEAVDWFRKRISKDLKFQANRIIDAQSNYKKRTAKQTARLSSGSLYTFEYEAEMAGGDHGMYDRFPMVFFFNSFKSKEGKFILLGLNVHYLTPIQRAHLYKGIMTLKNTKGISERTRLRLEWEAIVSVAGSKIAEQAVHAYRADRFRSQVVEIDPQDFIVAVFLRSERWVKPMSADPAVQSFIRKTIKRSAKA